MSIVTTSPRMRSKAKAGSRKPIVLVAAAIVIVVAAAYFLLREGSAPARPGPASDVENQMSGDRPSAPQQTSNDKTVKPSSGEADEPSPQRINEQTSERTNEPESSAALAAEDAEAAKRAAWAIADSNRLAKSEAIMLAAAPKQHFDNEVENVLERVSKPGASFLRLPYVDMSREEVLTYLRKPVEIYDDDDAEAVEAKERTAAFKTEALKFIEEGGTINQYIRDVAAAQTEARETVEEIRREKTRILKSKGLEAAQAYLDEVNPQLREAGLPEVKIGRLDYKILRDAGKDAPQR